MTKQRKELLNAPEKHLLSILERDEFVTSWHNNDEFLGFCDEFAGGDIKRGRRKLSRCMKTLVDFGYSYPSSRTGTGPGMGSLFGCNHQTIWQITGKHKEKLTKEK